VCEKCLEIDKNIERYRRIHLRIGDLATVDRTKQLIADLKLRKAALHPDQIDEEAKWAAPFFPDALGSPLASPKLWNKKCSGGVDNGRFAGSGSINMAQNLVEAMLGFHERIDSYLIEARDISAAANTCLLEKCFNSPAISDARICKAT
jgi:hypothetical protein